MEANEVDESRESPGENEGSSSHSSISEEHSSTNQVPPVTRLVSCNGTAQDKCACVIIQVPLVKENTYLCNLTEKMWTEKHDKQVMEYLVDTSVQLLLVYIDIRNGLVLAKAVPPYQLEEVAYFIKPQHIEVTEDNFYSVLQMGTAKGNFVDSLLRAMHDMYAPTFFESTNWPDSILQIIIHSVSIFSFTRPIGVKNDFSAQLHKFMAHLTDAQHKTVGHTVLYVPDEGPSMKRPNVGKDKDLVQRLEGRLQRCELSLISIRYIGTFRCVNLYYVVLMWLHAYKHNSRHMI